MISHAPTDYDCPFCGFLAGKITEYNNNDDMVIQNERAIAFVGPISWQKNFGNLLVIPKKHYENIYAIPNEDLAATNELVKQASIAMRATYGCTGVTIVQRNEPDAGQHVWHFHVHVVPRYANDNFKEHVQKYDVDAKTRAPYAQKLRDYLQAL